MGGKQKTDALSSGLKWRHLPRAYEYVLINKVHLETYIKQMVISFSTLFFFFFSSLLLGAITRNQVWVFFEPCARSYIVTATRRNKKKKTRAETLEKKKRQTREEKKNSKCSATNARKRSQHLASAGCWLLHMVDVEKHYCAATRSSPIGYIYAHSVCSSFSPISRLEKQ